jgi:hypothetical protein
MCVAPEILDRALADHEAGHLIVSVILERGLDQISLENIGGVRGCFYPHVDEANWDDFREILCLLAGPRAQVELCPESLTADQQARFAQTISQPRRSLWEIPAGYDGTYWGPDMDALYTYLAMPFAPVHKLDWGTQRREVVDRAEVRLKAFFSEPDRRARCRQVADVLKAQRRLPGPAAIALVQQHFEMPAARALLVWA